MFGYCVLIGKICIYINFGRVSKNEFIFCNWGFGCGSDGSYGFL